MVTSDFHMPRSRAIFEWVFGLQGAGTSIRQANGSVGGLVLSTGSRRQGFVLEYHGVSDIGIDTSIIQVLVLRFQLHPKFLECISTHYCDVEYQFRPKRTV